MMRLHDPPGDGGSASKATKWPSDGDIRITNADQAKRARGDPKPEI